MDVEVALIDYKSVEDITSRRCEFLNKVKWNCSQKLYRRVFNEDEGHFASFIHHLFEKQK